jgi:transmembrane sensor
MKASERVVTRVIEEQARAWLITNREQCPSDESRAEFLAWLQASPMHVCAYLAIAKIAAELESVAVSVDTPTEELIAMARDEQDDNVAAMVPWESELDDGTDPELAPPPQRENCHGRWPMAIAASIAVLAVAVLAWWVLVQQPANKEYFTEHGEQRIVRLDDGSVLHINSDSVLRVGYTNEQRSVSMERGQALFKVAKDASRPFRVRVGATDVIAVGTEFDVRRMSDDVVVTVVEGSVSVSKVTEQDAMEDTVPPAPLHVQAGQQALVISGLMPAVHKPFDVRVVDVRPAIAWVQQKIMFEDQTLQKVVSEFNRYTRTQMVIEDEQAAKLRISGIFNAYDLESFVLYLETLQNLEVRRELDRIRISLARDKDGNTT